MAEGLDIVRIAFVPTLTTDILILSQRQRCIAEHFIAEIAHLISDFTFGPKALKAIMTHGIAGMVQDCYERITWVIESYLNLCIFVHLQLTRCVLPIYLARRH